MPRVDTRTDRRPTVEGAAQGGVMRRHTSILIIGLALGLVAAPLVGSAAAQVKLGVVDNLTGAAAGYGIPHSNGIRLAVEEINAAGGIKGIGKIEMTIED